MNGYSPTIGSLTVNRQATITNSSSAATLTVAALDVSGSLSLTGANAYCTIASGAAATIEDYRLVICQWRAFQSLWHS